MITVRLHHDNNLHGAGKALRICIWFSFFLEIGFLENCLVCVYHQMWDFRNNMVELDDHYIIKVFGENVTVNFYLLSYTNGCL